MRVAAAFLMLLPAALLGGETWVTLTPADAQVGTSVIAIDPFAPDTLYANNSGAPGMAKSTDGGRTWRGLPFTAQLLTKIIVEPSAPNRVTALSWEAPGFSIHRSTDGGATWATYHPSPAITGLPNDLAVDPSDTNTLYLAHPRSCWSSCIPDSGGVSKSTDGGRHWTALFKGVEIDQVAIDPFGSGTIYAVGLDAARRSENGGLGWTPLGSTGDQPIFRIACDPVLPHVVYASTFNGFWRSDNRGDTWTRVGNPFNTLPAWTIAIDPTRSDVIVLGLGHALGVMRSMDGGHTWETLNDGLRIPQYPTQIATVHVVFAPNGQLYGAADFLGVLMLKPPSDGHRRRAARH